MTPAPRKPAPDAEAPRKPTPRQAATRSTLARTAVHLALLAALAATVLPYAFLAFGSAKPAAELFDLPVRLLPSDFTATHYDRLLDGSALPFLRQTGNSAVIAVLTTALVCAVSASVGWGFAKYRFPFRTPLFLVLLATLTLPVQVALVPLFTMTVELGWIDTFQGVVLPSGASAFGAFFMRQAMVSVPDELVEAARLDGASELRIFVMIGVPLARGALSVLAVLTFLASWNDYLWPSVVLRSPERQTYPIGLANLIAFYQTDYGTLLAGSFLVTVPIVVLVAVGRRHLLDNLALGALKG